MKTIDKVIPGVLNETRAAKAGPPAGAVNERAQSYGQNQRDHVDAINQLFTEFELAYHNQFHKAYAQEGSLNLAKKYWLTCLADFPPDVILRAARHVVKTQEFLPTVAAIVNTCENALPLFGLPPAHAAYVEACCASEPKARHAWSHPAVYHAAKATGWFELGTEPQSVIFPVFEYNYQQLCQRVLRGESLDIDVPVALPESVPQPLSPEENKARMKALRERFDL
ncbi:MAG: replication protein P [Pseudomonadota bacterium]|nr:replication protein P [Pseudomonadota bacterium]